MSLIPGLLALISINFRVIEIPGPILGVVYTKGLKGIGGIAIGGIVGLDIFFLAFISGAPMNPARSLAPALLSGGIKQSLALLVSHVRGNFNCCFSLSW